MAGFAQLPLNSEPDYQQPSEPWNKGHSSEPERFAWFPKTELVQDNASKATANFLETLFHQQWTYTSSNASENFFGNLFYPSQVARSPEGASAMDLHFFQCC